jgi:RHS repeat-associated protein
MAGQYYDAESTLFYNWNRYYNPATGRYISSDPIGLEGGINTFLYAAASPVMYIDPEGTFFWTAPIGFVLGYTLYPINHYGA